ncbi:MAG: formate--tetrahydrofolate ligase, partial [Planctomycetota bacterium]|nr:formate--tetrahydrofolate ligase [Planctomycetota bacterium]
QRAEQASEPFKPLYDLDASVEDKVLAIAQTMYGAKGVTFTKTAERELADVRRLGYEGLPICMAKTPASLSDDPKLRGRPADFTVTVRSVRINAGAGFLVALTGDILRMPGLPKRPIVEQVDLDGEEIVGLA